MSEGVKKRQSVNACHAIRYSETSI